MSRMSFLTRDIVDILKNSAVIRYFMVGSQDPAIIHIGGDI